MTMLQQIPIINKTMLTCLFYFFIWRMNLRHSDFKLEFDGDWSGVSYGTEHRIQ